MADSLDDALTTISRLLSDDTSAIELYRADFATPQNIEALRFWAQGEYNRIQASLVSADEVVSDLAGALQSVIEAVQAIEPGGESTPGEPGEPGPPGPPGAPGEPGECECDDIIDDGVVSEKLTWSSAKITQELQRLWHNDLTGRDFSDVHPMASITGLLADQQRQDDNTDRKSQTFIQASQPTDEESNEGDLWLVTT